MNRETLKWYSNKADEFLRSNANADMTRMYERFLHFMPESVRDEDGRVEDHGPRMRQRDGKSLLQTLWI